MKLLDEPRIQKEITQPKKKYKRVKKERVEGEPKVKAIILKEGAKSKINAFIELYKEDRFKARVKFFNGNSGAYSFSRLVLFEYDKDEFEIANFTIKFGISVTSKMYSSQKKGESLIYRKKKFWYRNSSGTIKPMDFSNFTDFIYSNENIRQVFDFDFDSKERAERLKESKVYQYFSERFHWIQTLEEFKHSYSVTFNTVVSKKLFGLKDLNRYIFKVPYNISKIVENSKMMERLKKMGRKFAAWEETLKVLDHVDHLRAEMLANHLFMDTCKMAKTLGRKVNCKWGLVRLKEEHDKWAREITRIILDCEKEFELNIRPEYKAFADFSGFRLLRTNKDMLEEGMIQNHCVGTYIDRVDRGDCAIFHVDGYTLQVGIESKSEQVRVMPETSIFGNGRITIPETKNVEVKTFKNLQFRGKHNKSAPQELVDEVQSYMDEFVKQDGFNKVKEGSEVYRPINSNRGTYIDGIILQVVMAQEDEAMPF
jgi:hypothetical protein